MSDTSARPVSIPRSRRSRLRRLVAFGLAIAIASGLSGLLSGNVQAARSIHVSMSGHDGAPGTATAPVRSIGRAVALANSGDSIVVRGGTYHESVQVFQKTVHIRAAAGEWVTLDGAKQLDGFVADRGAWYSPNWTTQFERNNGPMIRSDQPVAAYPDQVFYSGQPLRQVLSRGEVVSGTFFHETSVDRIWIGDDPTGRLVEGSNRSWAVYFNGAHGSSLTNMTVRRFATQGRDMAAIRAYADNLTFSGVISEYNAFSGLSAIGSDIVIRDSRFNHNGYIGIHGDRVNGLVVERSAIMHNNRELFDAFHSAAGIKVTSSSGVVVRDSDIDQNAGPGFWSDIASSGVTVAGNAVTNNVRSGIEIELTSGVTIANNVAIGNGESGIWILESQNVNVWHNAVVDNEREIYVLEGPRRDVANISIRNNIVGRSTATGRPLVSVDDWTEQRSASQMNVSADHNVFWRQSTSATPLISRWARWPSALSLNSDVAAQIASVGHGQNSSGSNGAAGLPVRSVVDFDYRPDASIAKGAPLSNSVASTLGLQEGRRFASGPVSRTVRRGLNTPNTQIVEGLTNPSTSADGYRHPVRLRMVG